MTPLITWTLNLNIDLFLLSTESKDFQSLSHTHTYSGRPLTAFENHQSTCILTLSISIIFIPIIACILLCLFRNMGDSGNTHPHTYLNQCIHTHTHTRGEFNLHTHLPGEWLTLVAKTPCGIVTFIGCQRQRPKL